MSPGTARLLIAMTIGVSASVGVLTINHSWITPGVHGDSVAYMTAAQSFVEHGSFRIPVSSWASSDSTSALSHFPPGFSMAMAVPMKVFGAPARAAALWTMAASAGIALGLVFWIVSAYAGLTAGVLSALLLLVTPAMTKWHLAIWSESLYLAAALIMLWVMLERPKRPLVYGTLAAVGVAIRYVGVVGTATAAIWAWRHGKVRSERMLGAGMAILPTALFLFGWSAYVSANDEMIRHVGLYPTMPSKYEIGRVVVEWLVPGKLGGVSGGGPTAALILLGIVGLTVLAYRNRFWAEEGRRNLALGLGIYMCMYVGVVMVSRLFLDPRIPFDTRIFMPIIVLITMAFAMSLKPALRDLSLPPRIAITGCIGLWCLFAFTEIQMDVKIVNRNGLYYSNWISDPVIRWIENQSGPYERIYSNKPELVYFHTKRAAKWLPDVGEDLDAFRATFAERTGAIVIAYPLQLGNHPERVWAESLGLRPVVRSENGAVYVPTTEVLAAPRERAEGVSPAPGTVQGGGGRVPDDAGVPEGRT